MSLTLNKNLLKKMLLRSMRGPDGLGTAFEEALPKIFFAPTGIPLQAVHAASEHVVALLVLHLHRVIPIPGADRIDGVDWNGVALEWQGRRKPGKVAVQYSAPRPSDDFLFANETFAKLVDAVRNTTTTTNLAGDVWTAVRILANVTAWLAQCSTPKQVLSSLRHLHRAGLATLFATAMERAAVAMGIPMGPITHVAVKVSLSVLSDAHEKGLLRQALPLLGAWKAVLKFYSSSELTTLGKCEIFVRLLLDLVDDRTGAVSDVHFPLVAALLKLDLYDNGMPGAWADRVKPKPAWRMEVCKRMVKFLYNHDNLLKCAKTCFAAYKLLTKHADDTATLCAPSISRLVGSAPQLFQRRPEYAMVTRYYSIGLECDVSMQAAIIDWVLHHETHPLVYARTLNGLYDCLSNSKCPHPRAPLIHLLALACLGAPRKHTQRRRDWSWMNPQVIVTAENMEVLLRRMLLDAVDHGDHFPATKICEYTDRLLSTRRTALLESYTVFKTMQLILQTMAELTPHGRWMLHRLQSREFICSFDVTCIQQGATSRWSELREAWVTAVVVVGLRCER